MTVKGFETKKVLQYNFFNVSHTTMNQFFDSFKFVNNITFFHVFFTPHPTVRLVYLHINEAGNDANNTKQKTAPLYKTKGQFEVRFEYLIVIYRRTFIEGIYTHKTSLRVI